MRNSAQAPDRSRFFAAVAAAVLMGGALGAATAQERPPGQLDSACAAHCVESGKDTQYCGRACWVPDPDVAARGAPLDWKCYSTCRDSGGKSKDCLPACRRR
jgi:hypothetical protein